MGLATPPPITNIDEITPEHKLWIHQRMLATYQIPKHKPHGLAKAVVSAQFSRYFNPDLRAAILEQLLMEGRIMENPVTIKRQRRRETTHYYIPLKGDEMNEDTTLATLLKALVAVEAARDVYLASLSDGEEPADTAELLEWLS